MKNWTQFKIASNSPIINSMTENSWKTQMYLSLIFKHLDLIVSCIAQPLGDYEKQ